MANGKKQNGGSNAEQQNEQKAPQQPDQATDQQNEGQAEGQVEVLETQVAVIDGPKGPASKWLYTLENTNSPALQNVMQGLLKEGAKPDADPIQAMMEVNKFISGSINMMPKFAEKLRSAELPDPDLKPFDDQMKAIDDQVTAINTQADEASKAIDDQIEALRKQRDEVRKPFAEQVTAKQNEKTEVGNKRTEALKPLHDAANVLLGGLAAMAKEAGYDEVLVNVLVENKLPSLNAPAAPKASSSGETKSTSSGGNRGGGKSITISKGSETHNFGSYNEARAFVWTQLNGSAPNYSANAPSCVAYLKKQGWTVQE